MSTLKDAEYAMRGEQTPALRVEEEFIPERGKSKDIDSPVNNEFVVFKLVGARNGGVYIPGRDYVIDPRTVTKDNPYGNGPEEIRLVRGITTIWAKEQTNQNEKFIQKNIETIEWPRGTRFMTVYAWEKTKLEFMRTCRHNIKSPNNTTGSKLEFFEYDPNEAAKAKLNKRLLKIEMITKAQQQEEEKMKRHAFYLGINLIDELGRPKPIDRLRDDYMLAAEENPEIFQKSFDSPEVDVQYMVRAAILDNKIDINRGDGRAYWSHNGELICSLATGTTPVKLLTDLALTKNKEGKEFKEKLKNIIT